MTRILGCVLVCCIVASPSMAQNEPTNGLRSNIPAVHALTHGRIVVSPDRVIEEGTLIIRDGLVENVGTDVTIPADARIWNVSGMTIYPGFIELSSTYGMPKPPSSEQSKQDPGPSDWNTKVRSHIRASEAFSPDEKTASTLRSQGFVLALTQPDDGIFTGAAAVVSLGNGAVRDLVKKDDAAQYITLERTGSFLSPYPNSLMGVIALIRQTFLDTEWYTRVHSILEKQPDAFAQPATNHSLEALSGAARGRTSVAIKATDDLDVLRASKIMKEFRLAGWIDGSGKEFRRLEAVRSTGLPIVVPVTFPEKPAVASPEEALEVTLEELREWDAAPENPGRLDKAGVPIALTTRDLKNASTFLKEARIAVERGLDRQSALRALTTTPARLLGMEKTHGTLDRGKAASFLVADGDVFSSAADVRDVWIDGKRFEVSKPPDVDIRGEWTATISSDTVHLSLKGEPKKLKGSFTLQGIERPLANVEYEAGRISFTVKADTLKDSETALLFSASASKDRLTGVWHTTESGKTDYGRSVWSALRTGSVSDSSSREKAGTPEMASFPDVFPLGAYGRPTLPPQPDAVLMKNATVWTMGPQGRVLNADVLIRKGKIASVGKDLKAPSGAVTIDATGMHITPGLFDAHSHTGVSRGINEGGQAITCEVRIEDVIDPDNIWIYRQLAGGTIGANVLHGSANPIGGQNAVVKWRWGALPDELLIRGAPKGVKFALGENVKRSNFRVPGQPIRYPASRMGVEQIIRDRFQAAREYERTWKEWERNEEGIPPRRDLELETIVEMLNGSRLIHAHSYRQDEILMLMRVAEDYGIRISTFQHVLEGYKVADVMARHGAGGSGFSDWWAYKWEAYDAIPGNLPLMHDQGVLVSYNSDNSQLATRLNWEAAKGLEYGMTEEEALASVTINPARQLGIDKLTGSIEPGKDADLAVWNGNPLSTMTKCVQTWVDGRKYFDTEEDAQLQRTIEEERSTLIQKALRDGSPSSAQGSQRTMRRPSEDILESCTEENDHE